MSKRLSLTLEVPEEQAVAPFTHAGPERDALASLAADHPLGSDAAVLRALIRVGADTVRDQLLQEGYAALAEEYRDERDSERETLRTRQTRRDAARD